MQTHQLLKPNKRRKKRIGRGGKRGTYSGRGVKGQKARSGRRVRPQIRDIIKRIHKRRGYFFKSVQIKPAIVNLGDLEKHFQSGEKITAQALIKAGLVKSIGGKIPKIKILGGSLSAEALAKAGETTKKLIFDKNLLMSKSAKEYVGKI